MTPMPTKTYPAQCKPTIFDAAPGYRKNKDGTLLKIHPEFLGLDLDDPQAGLFLLLMVSWIHLDSIHQLKMKKTVTSLNLPKKMTDHSMMSFVYYCQSAL